MPLFRQWGLVTFRSFYSSEEYYTQITNNTTSGNDKTLKEETRQEIWGWSGGKLFLHEIIREGSSEEITNELKPEPREIDSMHYLQEEHSSKRESTYEGASQAGMRRNERGEWWKVKLVSMERKAESDPLGPCRQEEGIWIWF